MSGTPCNLISTLSYMVRLHGKQHTMVCNDDVSKWDVSRVNGQHLSATIRQSDNNTDKDKSENSQNINISVMSSGHALISAQVNQSITASHTITQTEITYQTKTTHVSISFQSDRFASSQPVRTGVKPVCIIRTSTELADLKIPVSLLVEADRHGGQDGTPSRVAAPPDPPSGFR